MITADALTEEMLVSSISSHELAQAEACIDDIISPTRSGESLAALVNGNRSARVAVDFVPEGILCRCSCDEPGPCRHVYALLLKWVRDPRAFAVQPPARREQQLAVTPVEPPPAHRPDEPPAWLAMPYAERQRHHTHQLAEWLQRMRLQDLRLIARRRGWRLKSTDKASVAQHVAEAMAAPTSGLRAALELEEELQRVLTALILAGPASRADGVARATAALGGRPQERDLANSALRLRELGFALPAEVAAYGPHFDFCPNTVARRLLPVVHKTLVASQGPSLFVDEQPDAPPSAQVALADALPFVRVAGQIALLLHHTPVPLRPPMPRPLLEADYPGLRGWDYDPQELLDLQRGHRALMRQGELILTVPPPAPALPDEAVARLAPVAGGVERLGFLFALLVASGIIEPGSPVTIWPEVEQQYLSRDEAMQRAILARTYFVMTNWSEVWGLWPGEQPALQIKRHALYGYSDERKLYEDLAACRQAMLRALACLPDGRWVRLERLYPLLRALWPRFDEPVGRATSYYYGPDVSWFLAQPGSDTRFVPKTAEDWDLAQGRFVRRMLTGPLHWLGLADLWFKGDQLVAFRLRGLADLFWDLVDAPSVGESAKGVPSDAGVTVEADRISIRPSAVSAQALGLVAQFARLTHAAVDRFDYELDAQTAYHSYQAGAALPEIMAGWQQLLPVPMPAGLRDQLARWWSAYGRLHIYQGLTVIEFADDYALTEMKAATSLAQHILAEISPRLVIVDERVVPTLVAELEKAGYTPKQTDQV